MQQVQIGPVVPFLGAVDYGSPSHRHLARILADQRVGGNGTQWHFEVDVDPIALLPETGKVEVQVPLVHPSADGIRRTLACVICHRIYGLHGDVYDIPEHRGGAQIMDRPVEGYGGMIGDPVTSISAANIERITEGVHQTRYPNESILAHEFGHAIHLLGIDRLEDQSLAHRIQAAYSHAQENDLWPHTYLMGNIEEYFATLTSMWFNVKAESADDTWDGVRGPLNTRNELREYDPTGYDLLADIYPQTTLPYPWNTNPVNHDYGGHMDQLP